MSMHDVRIEAFYTKVSTPASISGCATWSADHWLDSGKCVKISPEGVIASQRRSTLLG